MPRWGPTRWIVLVALLLVVAAILGYVIGHGRAPDRGSVDVGFLDDMITHHEQAVQMSIIELANGEDERVQTVAREILQQQAYEIGLMDRQLQKWGYERANRPDTAMAWMDEPVPAAEMPGLATPEQMEEFRQAEGAEADAMFLQLMTAHHEGGVHMADDAAEHADNAFVRELAARMATVQRSEINEMALLADSLGVDIDSDGDDHTEHETEEGHEGHG